MQEYCDKYGVDNFTILKAQQNGASSMVTAIQEYGGWYRVRTKLGLPTELKESKRLLNLENSDITQSKD